MPTDPVLLLQAAGLDPMEVLGAGMEGTVVALGGRRSGTVAKVWHRRPLVDLERLTAFYAAFPAGATSYDVPRVLEVLDLDGVGVTLQPRLVGEPLWAQPGGSSVVDATFVEALVDVLAGLASAPAAPGLAVLPVLDGEAPFAPEAAFGHSLAGLVESRVGRSVHVLRAAVADLDDLVPTLCGLLRALDPVAPRLLHGDLVPGNVLVSRGRVSAVLDLGFLTTLGDPAFDVAVTASVADMYGPDARRTEAVLDRALADAFGLPAERLATYRLAYALVTATCFSASGSDGHFAWCVAMLARPDAREAAGA